MESSNTSSSASDSFSTEDGAFEIRSPINMCEALSASSSNCDAQCSPSLEACVPGLTIPQERDILRTLREKSLHLTEETKVTDTMTAYDFAFFYVENDRRRRIVNIKRSKERAKARQKNLH